MTPDPKAHEKIAAFARSRASGETVETLRERHADRMKRDEVLSIAYHRNGIGGSPFYVALVRVADIDQRVLVCIVPAWAIPEDATRPLSWSEAADLSHGAGVPCFAIDPGMASGPWTNPGTIEFGKNSWRGDHYFALVSQAAIDYNASR